MAYCCHHEFHQLASFVPGPCDHEEPLLAALRRGIDILVTTMLDDLQEEHAEAVDITLLGDPNLQCGVPKSAASAGQRRACHNG